MLSRSTISGARAGGAKLARIARESAARMKRRRPMRNATGLRGHGKWPRSGTLSSSSPLA